MLEFGDDCLDQEAGCLGSCAARVNRKNRPYMGSAAHTGGLPTAAGAILTGKRRPGRPREG